MKKLFFLIVFCASFGVGIAQKLTTIRPVDFYRQFKDTRFNPAVTARFDSMILVRPRYNNPIDITLEDTLVAVTVLTSPITLDVLSKDAFARDSSLGFIYAMRYIARTLGSMKLNQIADSLGKPRQYHGFEFPHSTSMITIHDSKSSDPFVLFVVWKEAFPGDKIGDYYFAGIEMKGPMTVPPKTPLIYKPIKAEYPMSATVKSK